MRCYIDVETKGLNCQNYITGCLKIEGKKAEVYRNKTELWNRILELGHKQAKRNKTLTIYSHNATYDFYAYANITDPNLYYYCLKPFIVKYLIEGKEVINFLDTMSIYRMSLEKMGELVGCKKTETPEILKSEEPEEISQWELARIEDYMIQDTTICEKAIIKTRELLKEHDITVRRLFTINQIGINHLLNEMKKVKNNEFLFFNANKGMTLRTKYPTEIHSAYRGGRVECFKLGTIENVNWIDINSLYPHVARNLKFPDLRTEKLTITPNEQTLNKIGITKALVKNNTNKLGLLPIRTETGNYYPKQGKLLIGTWTNQELKLALKEGYQLIHAEYSITYDEAPKNPLKNYMESLYKARKQEKEPLKNYFFKMMMNCCLGKLGQTRTGMYIVIDSVEKTEKYLKKNWKVLEGINLNYVFIKEENKHQQKKHYYTPIIPTLVNADARILMYQEMKKIPLTDLVYTDTDSIGFKGNHIQKYQIGEEMGQYKIEHQNQKVKMWGKKTYTIDNTAKIAGFTLREEQKEGLEKGIIKSKKMLTLKTAPQINQIGTFKEEERNLNYQLEQTIRSNELMEEEKIYIDNDIQNITAFMGFIKQEHEKQAKHLNN